MVCNFPTPPLGTISFPFSRQTNGLALLLETAPGKVGHRFRILRRTHLSRGLAGERLAVGLARVARGLLQRQPTEERHQLVRGRVTLGETTGVGFPEPVRRASRQASGGALCTEPVAEAVRRERLAEFGHQIGKVTRRRRIGIVKATWLDAGQGGRWRWRMKNLFRYFNSSPEVIGRTVMLYIRYPLSLRQVEDLLFELSLIHLRRCRRAT